MAKRILRNDSVASLVLAVVITVAAIIIRGDELNLMGDEPATPEIAAAPQPGVTWE